MKVALLFIASAAFAQMPDSIAQQLKSVEQQRQAVRAMRPAPAAEPVCDPMREEEIAPLIDAAARERELPVKLLRAVVEQESGFRACAESPKGAQGLMQLMPATAARYNVGDAFDPAANLAGGAAFLRFLLEKYKGDLPQALGAYNAGPETVDRAAGIPDIAETRAYIDAIVEKMGTKHVELPPAAPEKPGRM